MLGYRIGSLWFTIEDDHAHGPTPDLAVRPIADLAPDVRHSFVRQVWQVVTDAPKSNSVCNHTLSSGASRSALSFSRIRLPQWSSKCPAVSIHLRTAPYFLNHPLAIPSLQHMAGVCPPLPTTQLHLLAGARRPCRERLHPPRKRPENTKTPPPPRARLVRTGPAK